MAGEYAMNNEWVIAILFFVIGLIPAYYFYKISIKAKEPVYSIKSNNLISGSASTLDNLNISYKKRKVKNLTVSKILIYNRGAETIHRQDIATINPIKISSETCTILDASVLQVNNSANVFKVILEKGSQNIFIDFDYLDKNQGAVIQVVHTGFASENIGLYGDIKGVQKPIQISPDQLSTHLTWKNLSKREKIDLVTTLTILMAFSVSLSIGLVLVLSFLVAMTTSIDLLVFEPIFIALTSLVLLMVAFRYIGGKGFFPSINRIPQGLEKFHE
jgi:hypothetical protein